MPTAKELLIKRLRRIAPLMLNKIQIFYSSADEGYIVTSQSFPGISAFGENEEDALEEFKIAVKLCKESIAVEKT